MSSLLRQGSGAQTVATATDKRFRRAHVKPSRKRTPALKHTWMALRVFAVVTVLGYGGYRGVTSIAAAQTLQIGRAHV